MKYLAYYDTPENAAENRNVGLAATNKMTYICDALNRAGQTVEIISASGTKNKKGCRGKTVQLSEMTSLKLFSCMGAGSVLRRVLGRNILKLKLFFYLLCHIQKRETVIVYHSVAYAGMVTLLKRLKDFRLILEVEEIYADVTGREQDRKKEYKVFSAADAYIFPAEQLNRQLNKAGKPYTLICGTYQAEPDRNCRFEEPSLQNKIHCVYAGTFEPRKGGCQMAVRAAQYLPENYHMHIIGFGSEKDFGETMKLLEQTAPRCRCGLTYDGCLRGEEYIRFLQSCQIGLSTQTPDGDYNDTSFPSKILSYMANGLQVVTVRIPVVEESPVGQYMSYYDDPAPEAVAKAIMAVDVSKTKDSRSVLEALDREFVRNIKTLLEE